MLEFGNLLSPAFSLLSGLFLLLPLAVYVAPFAILFLWLSHPGVPALQQTSAPVTIKVTARDPWITNRGPLGLCPHYTDGVSSQSYARGLVALRDCHSRESGNPELVWTPAYAGVTIGMDLHESCKYFLASLPPTLYSAQSHGRAPPLVPQGLGGSWTTGQGPRAPPITETIV